MKCLSGAGIIVISVSEPYSQTDLRKLWDALEERWPKLPHDEAQHWLPRVQEARSPYRRVRVHAIRCQLDATIALALYAGLRRGEIFRARVNDIHPQHCALVVRDRNGGLTGKVRAVPFTTPAWRAVTSWLDCRAFLGTDHERTWLNLHAARTVRDPMTRHTFDKLPATYLGPGWTFTRLRDTFAIGWVRSGLPLEHLRELLGLSSIEATLPYARCVRGSLGHNIQRLDTIFAGLIEPVGIAA